MNLDLNKYLLEMDNQYSYSHTSKSKNFNTLSNYNKIYELMLMHMLGSTKNKIIISLNILAKELTKDGFLKEKAKFIGNGLHNELYTTFHLSAIFYQLVDYYNVNIGEIKYFINFNVESFLDNLNYEDAWNVSNIIMSLGTLLSFNLKFNKKKYTTDLHTIIDKLDNSQSSIGLWDSKNKKSLLNSMAAAFHYYPLYKFSKRKIHKAELSFKNILSLQNKKGFFSLPTGYSCIDLDAIYSLRYLYENSDMYNNIFYKRKLLKSTNKLYNALLSIQNNDGGFPDVPESKNIINDYYLLIDDLIRVQDFNTFIWNLKRTIGSHFFKKKLIYANSIQDCCSLFHETNAFTTWFRVLTLSICEDILIKYSSKEKKNFNIEYFNLPGLSFD